MSDIDNMTQAEIDSEVQHLNELRRAYKMTQAQADRLEMLKAASRRIRGTKRPRFWL